MTGGTFQAINFKTQSGQACASVQARPRGSVSVAAGILSYSLPLVADAQWESD